MNLYSGTPKGFDDESQEIGLMLAGHAAIALAGAQLEQHLRIAMHSRTSQETSRLADIAAEVTNTGAMPGTPPRTG